MKYLPLLAILLAGCASIDLPDDPTAAQINATDKITVHCANIAGKGNAARISIDRGMAGAVAVKPDCNTLIQIHKKD